MYALNVVDSQNDFFAIVPSNVFSLPPFSKASEEEILGAGSEPAEPDGVKTGNKEVEDLNEFVKIILKSSNIESASFSRLINLSLCVKRFQQRTLFSLSAGCCRPTRSR